MAGNKEVNSDLQIKGKINLKDVPNNTPTGFLVWNSGIKDIAQRTPAQIISDLGLITATNIAASYYTKTEVDTNIKTAVDNIQIGGRNLFIDGSFLTDFNFINEKTDNTNADFRNTDIDEVPNVFGHKFLNILSTSGGDRYAWLSQYVNAEKLTYYTISFSQKGAGGITGNSSYIQLSDGTFIPIIYDIDNQKKLTHFSFTFKTNSVTNAFRIRFGFQSNAGAWTSITSLKVEKGNKATDWTPAPEDQVSDWNQTNATAFDFIKNKPTKLSQFTNDSNFLTQETDPTVPAHVKSISTGNINNWNTAFGWGDYRQFGLGRPNELSASDLNSVTYTSILGINDYTSNRPFGYGSVWTHRKSDVEYSQIAIDVFTGKLLSRAFSFGSGDTGWKTPLYSEDLNNYVTLNTAQTITGAKTFNNEVVATSFIKNGGAATQFLKADGTVDSNTYLTSSALSPYAQTSWVNANFDKYTAWNLQTNNVQRTSMPSGSNLNLVAGANVTIGYSAGGTVTISATDTDTNTTYVAGDGISITGTNNVITNTKPNIVQTLSGSGNTVNLSNGGSYTIPAQSWESITGKPTTFPPDAHTHSQYLTQETDPTVPSHVKSISTGNIAEWNNAFKNRNLFGNVAELNDINLPAGNYKIESANIPGLPNLYTSIINTGQYSGGGYSQQLGIPFQNGTHLGLWLRTSVGSNWNPWYKMWDSSDFSQANINNWNTAFGWGNHATAGYLTSMPTHSHSEYVTLDTAQTISGVKTFTQSITAPAFYEGSLKSLKKNIKTFEKSGLDLVNQLDIVTFDRKDETAKNKIGIIADDSPKEFLSEELDAVDLYKTVFIQAKAIQELTEEVNNLRELVMSKLNQL